MTDEMNSGNCDIDEAIATLRLAGYAVLKAKSYELAKTKMRVAEARAMWAAEDVESSRNWAVDCLERERRSSERASYLYGVAARHGATDEELRGPLSASAIAKETAE